ncbi:uncharacterized protein LOC107641068 [Arachis ipaensis]|uniref:uncharacterized protein LOC107641068 n=1 Tax=Arachis ipaensis TaxID=130454 RepID=UPI0007AFA668|nr:uncharacterized protein LOC107641068 [Arachis ipaensis]XP_020980128.1 uncharacterized protein LOC107641068 [Arachis ipaensis]XP_020980129.1 uncharacterized protein LOC107641068 [Arachis ipaensis]XP_020980130.1 uncharacterized protein LOC107641068 [Arachis ipaensis]XP_020980131.1 uncharacterized protein LOC107641068 [Arachis ipaensis]XP_020980132.1 uncharacterized protein LOC107641068 [Arachis ipaensis]XP_025655507.1 uncharacterized protein LOC112750842 [Arachis hypogaea]XP_025655508.1 unc
MEGTANLRVYYNSEIIPHTHEGEIIPHPFSLVIPCTMTFAELQNNLCRSIQSHISKRVNNILYRNPVILFGKLMQFHIMSITDDTNMQQMFHIYQQSRFQVTMIELYVEFEHLGTDAIDHESDMDEVRDIVWEEDNSDSEDDFEANYEVNDENEDENEYANIGVVAANDGEFSIRMEFSSKESVISAIKNYTISRGVAYTMYAFQPMTLYAKCKRHDKGCDWLIRASLNRKKGYWEIRSYNGRHTCTTGTISQNHFKLDSNMIVDAIRPLVEVNPSLKVKSIIAEVQSKFNYTVSYRKAWLAKQKCVAKIFGDWKISYRTLPWWCMAMCAKMPGSRVRIETLPIYRGSEEVNDIRILRRVFWSFSPCIRAFRHCKPLVQVDSTRLYGKFKGTLLVAIAQDGNQNIVPIAFAIVESETADEWDFFLHQLRKNVVTQDGVGIISNCHESIQAAIARSDGAWAPPRARHMFCIRHIGANFLKRFKTPHLHKLVINIGYSRTKQEYNINYERLRERGEAYTNWCDEIGLQRWVLAFDEGYRWGHMTTNMVECINSALKGARNLPVNAVLRATCYWLNKLFTRKSDEAHERIRNGFTYSEFATRRVKENLHRAGNIVVNRFDRHNEVFEVHEMDNGSIFTVNLAQRVCDCGHFQVERLPCRHVLACCANQRLDWQVYVNDVYKMSEIRKVYSAKFAPLGDPDTWPKYKGPKVIGNPSLMKVAKGQPKSTPT